MKATDGLAGGLKYLLRNASGHRVTDTVCQSAAFRLDTRAVVKRVRRALVCVASDQSLVRGGLPQSAKVILETRRRPQGNEGQHVRQRHHKKGSLSG